MTVITSLLLSLFANVARAEFPPSFPPRALDAIEEIIESYERGEVPYYRTELGNHFQDDDVLTFGPAAGVVAGLQLHSKYFSPEARKALVLGVGRLAAAALHLGALEGLSVNEAQEDAREHLGYLYTKNFDPELNAIQLLQQIARGRKLKALSEVATEALGLIYAKADMILSRKGTFKDSVQYDDEGVETILNWMFSIDERAAVRDLKRYAERGVYTGAARFYVVNRLAERDDVRMWQVCHEALSEIIERKPAK